MSEFIKEEFRVWRENGEIKTRQVVLESPTDDMSPLEDEYRVVFVGNRFHVIETLKERRLGYIPDELDDLSDAAHDLASLKFMDYIDNGKIK